MQANIQLMDYLVNGRLGITQYHDGWAVLLHERVNMLKHCSIVKQK